MMSWGVVRASARATPIPFSQLQVWSFLTFQRSACRFLFPRRIE